MYTDFLSWAPSVALYFICFGVGSFAFAYLLKRFTHLDWLECLCASLALSQLMKILSMVVSSAFNALDSLYIYLYLGSIGVLLLACYLISNKQISFEFLLKVVSEIRRAVTRNPINLSLAFFLLVLFLFILVVRAVYFFDNTYDVVNYGYSKIALLFQNNSIFYLSGLNDLRIDASERNGELYFLHAFLLTGDLRLIGLAGVEVWLCILISIFFLLRQFRVDNIASFTLALFVSSSPVVFGLSGITKGDSWAIFNYSCATGFLVSSIKAPGFSAPRLFFFIIFLAFAATTKMTVAFGVAPMFVYGMVMIYRKEGRAFSIYWLVALFLSLLIAANKQIQNFLVYQNPFKRQEWETSVSGFKLENFLGGWPDFVLWLFGFQGDLALSGWQVDMIKGMGLTFILILLFMPLILFLGKNIITKTNNQDLRLSVAISMIAFIGFICLISYIPNQMEAFQKHWCRFLAPYFLVFACICLAGIWNKLKHISAFVSILLVSSVFAVGFHWVSALKTSNILSHRGKSDMIQQIITYDRYKSRFGQDFLPGSRMLEIYKKNNKHQKNVLAYTFDYDAPYFWIFGDNFIWNTDVTDKEDVFLKKYHNQKYDLVVIAHNKTRSGQNKLIQRLKGLGMNCEQSGNYSLVCDNTMNLR